MLSKRVSNQCGRRDGYVQPMVMRHFTLKELVTLFKGEVIANGSDHEEYIIENIADIAEGKEKDLVFMGNRRYEKYLYTTEASAALVPKDFSPKKRVAPALIAVNNVYEALATFLHTLNQHRPNNHIKSESPAYLGQHVKLGQHVFRGAFSYIGNNTVIGDNVKIYPQTYIGERVSVGEGTIIYAGVKIYDDVDIGPRCVIHSGAVLGSDGFGFAKAQDGTYKNIPQIGKLILENDVQVGANTTIDRATFSSTYIEEGVKLDNLIQIGHNVRIGAHTIMAAQAGVSGSTKIGKKCMLAGQAGIAGHLEVAPNTIVGAQAGISTSITQSGKTMMGTPAEHYRDFVAKHKLDKKVRTLENQLLDLQHQLEKMKRYE